MPKEFLTDVDLKAGLLFNGAAGTSGAVLSSNGSGASPAWRSTYTVSSTAPGYPVNGDRWVDSDNGIEYTYIDDGNTSQWVETGAPGVIPTNITTSTSDPTGGADGDIWIKYTA